MVKIPAAVQKKIILGALRQGSVFRLKRDIPFQSDVYHVFVVLNYDPRSGETLIVANGTSQIEKRYAWLESLGIDVNLTTVGIVAQKYQFLTKDTLFDCNSIHKINFKDINFNDDSIRAITCDELLDEDIDKMIKATLASPLVPPYLKALIKPAE